MKLNIFIRSILRHNWKRFVNSHPELAMIIGKVIKLIFIVVAWIYKEGAVVVKIVENILENLLRLADFTPYTWDNKAVLWVSKYFGILEKKIMKAAIYLYEFGDDWEWINKK